MQQAGFRMWGCHFPGNRGEGEEKEEELSRWDKRGAICSCTPMLVSCSWSRKTTPARGIIPQHGASHTSISTIFYYDFQYAPCCLSLTPLGNVLTHQVVFPWQPSMSINSDKVDVILMHTAEPCFQFGS